MLRTEKQREADTRNLVAAGKAKASRRVTVECGNCETAISVPPCLAKRKKYCSWECRRIGMRGNRGANAGGGAWMCGSDNPNWKDGTGKERLSRENQDKSNQWRRRVFARDNHTCQHCELKPKKGGQLNAHHIMSWAEYPEERFSIGNGLTLCISCHKTVHRRN